MTYERITFRTAEGGRRRTILRDPKERDTATLGKILSGEEVDREGQITDRIHIISVDLVEKRTPMQMDNHYGRLETIGEAR